MGTIDEDTAAEVIPWKDSTVLVYCRSGNRSKTASSTLAELGYTNIYEFGGINTWPYETGAVRKQYEVSGMKQLTWEEYYDGFYGWSSSTQKSYAYRLSDYGPADEVWEIAEELDFVDSAFAAKFLKRPSLPVSGSPRSRCWKWWLWWISPS